MLPFNSMIKNITLFLWGLKLLSKKYFNIGAYFVGLDKMVKSGSAQINKLKNITLSSHLTISPNKRYVDDIYLQTTNEETAHHFHHIINNVQPSFEIEKPETTPSGLSFSLLDFKFTISKDGKSSFEFCKKPAKKPLFVHHQSAIPTKSKLNLVRNERKRMEDRCSSHISAIQHPNTFDDILRLNGYPENIMEQTKRPRNPQRNPQPANTEWSYLKIPYISERLNHKITSIFGKEMSRYALSKNPTRSDKPYPTPQGVQMH